MTDKDIAEQAKKEALEHISQYAPHSYRAGFEDGARWMLEQLRKQGG